MKEKSNRSLYDPSRDTVGAIYRNAQFNGEKQVITGDMNYELRKSLVDDINDTVKTGTTEFEGKEFYITVHEKRDLQMPNAFLRRMIKTLYRPYPEDDTLVFRVIPAIPEVFFCWELPHWSNMANMIQSRELHDPEQMAMIDSWKRLDLHPFGFMKNEEGNWKANPGWKDQRLVENKPRVSLHLP